MQYNCWELIILIELRADTSRSESEYQIGCRVVKRLQMSDILYKTNSHCFAGWMLNKDSEAASGDYPCLYVQVPQLAGATK
jgi:hypothetical protein